MACEGQQQQSRMHLRRWHEGAGSRRLGSVSIDQIKYRELIDDKGM